MPVFDYSFTVDAPLARVVAFHRDTSVLKRLTPPPLYAQIHEYEPLGEGSRARFTLWFGPLPVRWEAVHAHVSRHGFTDIQVRGPLQRWRHAHRFTAVGEESTRIHEHIEYEHHAGLRGVLSRLLFSRPALTMLFGARKLLTRHHVYHSLVQVPTGRVPGFPDIAGGQRREAAAGSD